MSGHVDLRHYGEPITVSLPTRRRILLLVAALVFYGSSQAMGQQPDMSVFERAAERAREHQEEAQRAQDRYRRLTRRPGSFIQRCQASPRPARHPDVGVEVSVEAGQPMYAEFEAISEKFAVVKSPFVEPKTRQAIEVGAVLFCSLLFEEINAPQERFCIVPDSNSGRGADRCLVDEDGDGRTFEAVGGAVGDDKALSTPVEYEASFVSIRLKESGSLSREVLYSGAGGGQLRLGYQESSGTMAPPTLSEEFSYELPAGGSTTVTLKGAKIEVLEAGNLRIRYKVLSGFGQ